MFMQNNGISIMLPIVVLCLVQRSTQRYKTHLAA